MSDPELTSTLSESSRSSLNPRTSYRVTRTIVLEDISSKFSNRERICSEKFFCQHDPHPVFFHFDVVFDTWEKNYFSASVYCVSHDATLIYSKFSACNDQGILVNMVKWGRQVLKKGKGYGAAKLLSREAATSGAFASASWRIVIEFEYEATSTSIPKLAPSSSSELRLQNDFRQLLISEKDADVVFLVDGKKIRAHKIILTTRCEYFESMFNSGMAESSAKEIVVTDVEPAVFKQLLNFVYADITPDWGKGLTSDTAMKLLTAADKYGVGDLKKYCEVTICSRLNADNVIQALLTADAHDCPDLMATAMSVFGSHMEVLKIGDKWNELKKSPSLLLKLLEHCHG